MKDFHRRGAEGAEKKQLNKKMIHHTHPHPKSQVEELTVSSLNSAFLCVLCASAVNNSSAVSKVYERS